MLIDMHGHTAGISRCCRIDAREGIRQAVEAGFDGMVITNHYEAWYYTEESYDGWIESYIAEWELCRELGREYGFRIFCGIEVSLAVVPNLHLLIYGADADFLRKYPHLCRRSLQELSQIVRENGCALIQAHPFRHGVGIQDTDLLDGVEINCHPKYDGGHAQQILAAAGEKRLVVTVGCDYHADSARPAGGSIIPEQIRTDRELAQYLLSSGEFSLQIHDPVDTAPYTRIYRRG